MIFALYWFISIIVAILGALFRSTEYPEIFFVKKNVKKKLKLNETNIDHQYSDSENEVEEILKDLSIDKKWYFYISTSHNWWHIFVNTVD